jgi:hypothetical protein
LVWTHSDKENVKAKLLYDNAQYDRKDISLYLASLFGERSTGHTGNLMYPLTQEAVEIHDLGVTLRKMARLSLRCGTAAVDPRNTPDESAHYLQRQAKYYVEVFDLRNRPRARLDELMADQKFKGTENGAIQVKRLKDIKASISGDPFTDLDMEDLGWELTRTKEPNFWVQDAMPTTSAETSTLSRQSHTETSPWEGIDVPLAIADGTSLS